MSNKRLKRNALQGRVIQKKETTFSELLVPFPMYSERVMPGSDQVIAYPLLEVNVALSKKNLSGIFVVDILLVTSLFNRSVGNQLNNKTIVKRGIDVPPTASKPILRVDFAPTIENLARYVYTKVRPAFARTLERRNIQLDYVTATTTIGKASFGRRRPSSS
ncbi:6-carboxytetrahydropterin synthase [Marininema halotolerans]|uniref:6-carboxy-5,6,7,8-tetrahydropterin synthase n=1 Tax=Marininema halotolerans TaxID=1155944 RepID=A0A1I6R7M6_9BACL|nr:6-carboxytetrahydropterin synthase [Marininema halotolerans]SFS60727.1 6-pyruvoyl tetrahydropterin synthase [Marininema halotolerans]